MGYKLGGMAHLRWIKIVSAGLVTLVACRGEKPAEQRSSAVTPGDNGESSQIVAATPRWNTALGGALILPSSRAGDAKVWIIPPTYVEPVTDTGTFDVTGLARHPVDLFNRSGLVTSAMLASVRPPSDDACDDFPAGALSMARGGWTVALESGRATAVGLDSIEAMSPTDSAAFAAQITGLVSTLPETRDSVFSSVPFAVQGGYRFRTGELDVIIATVQRSIPSEANPRLDNTIVIAERPVGAPGAYQVGFVKRSAGAERDAGAVNPLAVVLLGSGRQPVVLVKYEYFDGITAGVIERIEPRHWVATWTSGSPGC